MKHIVLPALSLVLLAAMPAQAQSAAHTYLQIAQQDNPDHPHRGGAQPSPAVVPAGSVDNSSTGHDHATGTGSGHAAGGAGHGGAGSPPATGTPTILGGHGTGTTGGTGHGGAGTGGVAGGGQTGGAGSTGDRNRGGAGTGGIDRTGGGILLPGTPTGGHGTGGAATGDHAGGTPFGTRPSNWNQYPRTFNRGTYQRNVTAPRHYHWQSYNQPRGYYYRRWVFGQIFPRMFWAQDYWLSDYWMFDLPVPPYGYVWVRYGDDALLINKRTGVVLQVVYGLFD